jgi:hypothetical protein
MPVFEGYGEYMMENTEETAEEKEARLLSEIRSKRGPIINPKEMTKLLTERERLRFECGNCRFEWTKICPDGYTVRSGDGTNFFVPIGREDGIRTYIYCPNCRGCKSIRRLPVIKLSSHPQGPKKALPEMYDDPFTEPSA